ncbi:fluoride efflux transporter CrcB [Nocardioides mangrovicus]|uniref:Fluoride-specific ion channel FluC n=1 Tax=Nocardioides mangrovicus TaxID=2478913 RepID=A0A3L8P839_9ACTN|nr:fluoride efflux transporter CrcB [Nocardioides mangrovicus]RLV50973.1 fluoride efflux transporter CrcB [Nocardioides mangrovicus]
MSVLLVLLGGAVGAPLRYLTDRYVQARHDQPFAWGTFLVNVAGSLLLGIVAGAVAQADAPTWVQTLVGTGVCGALTTFSTFSVEIVRLLEERRTGVAGLYVVASLVAGFAALSLGWWLAASF